MEGRELSTVDWPTVIMRGRLGGAWSQKDLCLLLMARRCVGLCVLASMRGCVMPVKSPRPWLSSLGIRNSNLQFRDAYESKTVGCSCEFKTPILL
jgi:hypothetical protein